MSFVQQHVAAESAIQGVVVVGSVAAGIALPDSDIDAVVFLQPLDLYAVPAEFKWQTEENTFHGIY